MDGYKLKKEFKRYTLFILDCDGVVWRGNKPILSAIKSINKLKDIGKKVLFLTNNSALSRENYIEKFVKMGIQASIEDIYTSSYATALFLKKQGIKNVYAIGEKGLYNELKKVDINIGYGSKAEAVIVGIDRKINYRKIAKACKLLRDKNKLFIATNLDPTIPTPYGEIPGAGSIISSISICANRKPDVIIGKPSKEIFKLVILRNNAKPSEVLVIGDRLETDILGTNNANLDSVLVLTGVTKKFSPRENIIVPTYVLKNLYELFE